MKKNILIFITLVLLFVLCLYTIMPSGEYSISAKPVIAISANKVIQLFNEVSWQRSLIMDTKYFVYPYDITRKTLQSTCYEAWSMIPSYNIGVEPDYYDCEDISMLILSHLRLKLKNVPCFMYVYYNYKKDSGHAMLACVVYKNGKLDKLYYDVTCNERKGFKLKEEYVSFIVG